MPQASAYLHDESTQAISDDVQMLDGSKPETWPLFLPSTIPKDDRSPCYKGVVETERVLRLAQLQDNLVDLRRFRRTLRNLRLYFKTNMAGEGQKTQTKSRTIETSVNNRIKRAVSRYRTAYGALIELDPTGDWTMDFLELRDEDNRGPLKELGEIGTGDGRYTPSWIWTTPSSMTLPSEGSITEQQEVSETARHEWMTCRARADRWVEEVELLQEEMRRVVIYLEWKASAWTEKVGIRAGSCAPDIQHGVDAYARKQANVHHEIAVSFASQWLPYLHTCGLETGWAAVFPWAFEILSHKAKLPKWFPANSQDTSHVPLPTGPSAGSTGGLGTAQEYPGGQKTQKESDSYNGDEHLERPIDIDNEGPGGEEQGPGYSDEGYYGKGHDNEGHDNEGCDDEGYDDEGYDDESYNDESCDDGTEANNGFDFEYDDDYMS